MGQCLSVPDVSVPTTITIEHDRKCEDDYEWDPKRDQLGKGVQVR